MKAENEKTLVFDVHVARLRGNRYGEVKEDMDYEVTVERGDYERLTNGGITPEELVEKSFKFLLERESKESILKQFNLMEIARYFPEYEREISE